MQLNYFGCLRVTMGLLPGMVAKRSGHVVNISSIGVLTNAPRFSAYVASKAALDAWTRCASSEFADQGITFTTINMPLVRTPMIAPTKIYNNVPTLAPEEAADMIAQACISKPVRIATRLGIIGAGAARAGAARRADRDEHQLPHVPGLVGGQGRQGRQAAAVAGGGGDAADDARHPLLARRRHASRPAGPTRDGRRCRH